MNMYVLICTIDYMEYESSHKFINNVLTFVVIIFIIIIVFFTGYVNNIINTGCMVF